MRRAISIIILVALAVCAAAASGCVLEHQTANLVQPQPDGNQLIVGRSSWALNWNLKPVADIIPAAKTDAGNDNLAATINALIQQAAKAAQAAEAIKAAQQAQGVGGE